MDPKDLSPAYLTSLAFLLVGALLVGVSSSLLSILGWVLLLAGLGLNIFSTLVMIQRSKGGPLPAVLTGGALSLDSEGAADMPEAYIEDETPVTESHEIISPDTPAVSDERIFRTSRPRVR